MWTKYIFQLAMTDKEMELQFAKDMMTAMYGLLGNCGIEAILTFSDAIHNKQERKAIMMVNAMCNEIKNSIKEGLKEE